MRTLVILFITMLSFSQLNSQQCFPPVNQNGCSVSLLCTSAGVVFWHFGDGNSQRSTAGFNHTYCTPGTYTITSTNGDSFTVTVSNCICDNDEEVDPDEEEEECNCEREGCEFVDDNFDMIKFGPNPFLLSSPFPWQIISMYPGGNCDFNACNIEIEIFDNIGQKVNSLSFVNPIAGQVNWDGTDFSGQNVTSGLYEIVLTFCNDFGSRKVVTKVNVFS